jgi:NADH-quinone oxidoreductase subunit M
MTIGAAYLLWLYQRMFTGDLSDFLRGLGHHLTDMDHTEILTLAPLAALVVVFGVVPGLLLGVLQAPTDSVIAALQGAGQALGLVP